MELKGLVGEHVLDAVDFSSEQVKTWGNYFENCQVMRFRLDGNIYVAIEDPEDGYRSCMRDLAIAEDELMKNVFVPTKVIGRYKDRVFYNESDILELVDVGTGKVVLEVGTDYTDDYYPSFVASFLPENMTCNIKNKAEENNG